ncbi:DUF6933 domain-containing protein [Paenibacillus barengoltzii]|jgi:hypothetical protein|uniref:DUF6933 domain-containing protein n=1 Tax=Paenibacillus TaxID=44249 RepID=UPI0028FD5DF4|nr:hypothetical protein [Paenibacillus sp. 3LSP]MDU0331044.1 hypothetical protein [Paenibacillus sp. 3LSP]
MITIQCTKKLAAEFDVSLFKEKPEHANPLYCWHAHLFAFHRRKCVLVMNNETRYNFVMFGLVKVDFKQFPNLFVKHISRNLLADGMEQALVDKYTQNCRDVSFASTSDRSIIGQINEMIMVAKYEMEGNLDEFGDPRNDQVNRMLNRYAFLKLPQLYSGETMHDVLQNL